MPINIDAQHAPALKRGGLGFIVVGAVLLLVQGVVLGTLLFGSGGTERPTLWWAAGSGAVVGFACLVVGHFVVQKAHMAELKGRGIGE